MRARKPVIGVLALLGLAVLLVGPTAAHAQVVAKMTGVVVDGEGIPIEKAKVYVRDVSTNITVRPAETSSKGRFIYTSLPPASYVFWAEKEGYMLARLIVRITGGTGQVQEQVYFYDDKQEFAEHTVRALPTGGTLTLVKNEFEFTMTTPDNFTALVNRLYAEYKGIDAGEGAEAAAPAAPKEQSNFDKAMGFIAGGNAPAAVPFLTLAVQEPDKTEDMAEAHYQLGKATLDLGDFDTALASLQKAQELDPTKPGVSFHLARTYNEKGMKTEAAAELEKELALSPDSEVVMQNLAGFYAQTGETGKAIEMYEKILAINPESFDAYQALAGIYKAAGERQKEAEVYQRMGDKDPSGQSLYNLGNLAFNSDDREKAKFYYERVIEKNPKHSMAHYQLANTLLGLGDIKGAVTHLEEFVKLTPKDPRAEEAKATATALKEMLKSG